jgi:transposase, IS5 family
MTRVIQNPQMQFGEVDISQIEFHPKCRDDIPKILKGLQYIYTTPNLREEVFRLLEEAIAPKINKRNGRPGMELWKIFVMGVLRLDLNCDYDRLQELVNQHATIRQMLGHPDIFDKHSYHLQTIKDNVSLLTPELLDQLNQVIVQAGHVLLKKKGNAPLRGRCDSFVVETHVHFPTDINLLFDAVRKVIEYTARLSKRHEVSDWRQWAYNIRQAKRFLRIAQNKKRSSARTEELKKKRDQQIRKAHREYMDLVKKYLSKAQITLDTLQRQGLLSKKDLLLIEGIHKFMRHAHRQLDQIERRVLQGEKIPHPEKVFSLFEPHTEWVMKGKAGIPVELGLKICVMEDQHQFILHHRVLEKQTDDQVAVPMVLDTKKRFPNFSTCSFDKGFHSPDNQIRLSQELDAMALRRKGKLSQKARAIEESEEFQKARRKHSAVESAINALEVHGLDQCPDHGLNGFKRYVALAIVARNIHRIGMILEKQERKCQARKKKQEHRNDDLFKLAA